MLILIFSFELQIYQLFMLWQTILLQGRLSYTISAMVCLSGGIIFGIIWNLVLLLTFIKLNRCQWEIFLYNFVVFENAVFF